MLLTDAASCLLSPAWSSCSHAVPATQPDIPCPPLSAFPDLCAVQELQDEALLAASKLRSSSWANALMQGGHSSAGKVRGMRGGVGGGVLWGWG